jgi:hypothetical protein
MASTALFYDNAQMTHEAMLRLEKHTMCYNKTPKTGNLTKAGLSTIVARFHGESTLTTSHDAGSKLRRTSPCGKEMTKTLGLE